MVAIGFSRSAPARKTRTQGLTLEISESIYQNVKLTLSSQTEYGAPVRLASD